MFLAQAMNADRSCQNVVNETAFKRVAGGLPTHSTHTGAYCRARKRLPLEMVSTLTRHTGRMMHKQAPEAWRWRGRAIKLVDGTTVPMPDTPANQAAYPQPRSQQPGLGCPLCRLVGILCLASGALLDAAIGTYHGKGSDEQSLLRTLLGTLETNDILLGDAYYATYFLFCQLQELGVDAVFEQQGARRRSTDFRRGQRLGQRDHLIELQKPKKKPDWMTQEHYDQAPGCKTPEMAKKEIWVYLLAYNLIRLLMAQAGLLSGQHPRTLSFKHTLQLWIAWERGGIDTGDYETLSALCALITQQKVGNRPGRIEPRAIKRRPKPYPLMTKSRPLARDEVRKHAHAKKLK